MTYQAQVYTFRGGNVPTDGDPYFGSKAGQLSFDAPVVEVDIFSGTLQNQT